MEILLKHIHGFKNFGIHDESYRAEGEACAPQLLIKTYILADKLNVQSLINEMEFHFIDRLSRTFWSRDPYNVEVWNAIAQVFSMPFKQLQIKVRVSIQSRRKELMSEPELFYERLLQVPVIFFETL